jgi:hypothetical protein
MPKISQELLCRLNSNQGKQVEQIRKELEIDGSIAL